MDPIRMLLADHRQIEAYLETYAWVRPRMSRRKHETVGQLQELLELHLQLEEAVLFPALRGLARAQGPLLAALEEHAMLRWSLAGLAELADHDPRLEAKLHGLDLVLRHHMREEEDELLALAKHRLSKSRLATMAEELEARRSEAQRSPRVTISRSAFGGPFGVEAAERFEAPEID